jgi:FkbM family methyltransferase
MFLEVARFRRTHLAPTFPLLPSLPRIKIVDVGASQGGEPDAFEMLARAVPCEIVGFEPAANECEKLNRLGRPWHSYMPYVVGDGSTRAFHRCESPFMSSLFEPNIALLEKFHNLAPFFRVIDTHEVETKRLDDIPATAGADFLKVDVQGGELLVFQGAKQRLKDVLVIHTEVEFVPMYINQPLFADIDLFLRLQGFALHRLLSPSGLTFRPVVLRNDTNAISNQLMWADAVYVRDFMALEQLPSDSLLKLAAILHENYSSFDLAAVALGVYDEKKGTRSQASYLQRLMVQ